MDELKKCKENDEFYGAPDWYKFKHPCGHIEKIEQFFYDPKHPEQRVLIVQSIIMCEKCNCYFIHGLKKYCQGIEILESK
jgi:uncharacterized lipoprotein YddW (UPF0748 family)